MTKYVYDFTVKHQFHGEFFPLPDDNSGRFSAIVTYEPYQGLILDYSISDKNSPMSCDRLYGVLSNGEMCTLMGPFDFINSGVYRTNGGVTTRAGKHPFSLIVFGRFYTENELIDSCIFSFYGMQDFIHPQGFLSKVKYSDTPILSMQGDNWKIEVVNSVSYKMIGSSLINLIHSYNQDAMSDLTEKFEEILKNHPKAFFNLRDELKFFFRMYNYDNDIICNIVKIGKILGLFSILLDKPVLPEELFLKFSSDTYQAPVLYSIGVEQGVIDFAYSKVSYHYLPFNYKSIELNNVIGNWLGMDDRYESLISAYQHDTGYLTHHQAHADVVLYATLLESVGIDLGNGRGEKYMRPIEEYASKKFNGKIVSFFNKFNSLTAGENIATLRNELAHIGRPKVLMKKMKSDDYVEIGRYMKIIITSHLLNQLGVDREKIHVYQDRIIG